MKNILKILFAAALVIPAAGAKTVGGDEISKAMTEENVIIIDVRTPEEYSQEHLKNAVNMDFRGADFEDQAQKLDKDKIYVVYCRTGVRSAAAEKVLNEKGVKNTLNLEGGITKWKKEGRPLSK